MLDFVQKLTYFILSLQEKILVKKLGKTLKTSYSNKTSKRVFSKAASLELNAKTESKKKKLENDIKIILKKYKNNPERLLDFIKRSGTNVYKIPFANLILNFIGYEEGFIAKTKGLKAFYLNIVITVLANEQMNFSFETSPMFILKNSQPDHYYMIQQFHKWYAMKLSLPGFDSEAQDNFQKFLIPSSNEKIKELSIDEILGLKEAIARDVEAINFVVDFAKSTTGSKNAMQKIVTGGASI